MATTTVLVVDDSLTMRALISRTLDGIAGVQVVGTADGAAEARQQVEKLRPDVMTLDVEMPVTNGIEYLAEIMGGPKPMPVVMFSTLTEAGANASVEALKLGAIDCFPKPKVASQAEFDSILGKLAKCIRNAKSASTRRAAPAPAEAPPAAPVAFQWNGRVLAIGADASSTAALFELVRALPADCPPTVIASHVRADLVESLARQLDEESPARVVPVTADGAAMAQGTIYFAGPGDAHVVLDTWPNGRLRLMPRDPVSGQRPSISLLLASVAKAAQGQAVGVLMTGAGEDGQAGVKAILAGGGHAVAPGESGYVLTKGMASQPVESIAASVLKLCGQ